MAEAVSQRSLEPTKLANTLNSKKDIEITSYEFWRRFSKSKSILFKFQNLDKISNFLQKIYVIKCIDRNEAIKVHISLPIALAELPEPTKLALINLRFHHAQRESSALGAKEVGSLHKNFRLSSSFWNWRNIIKRKKVLHSSEPCLIKWIISS